MADDLLTALISRDDFRAVVKHASHVTKDHFHRAERDRLALVADRASKIAYGEWKIEGVGCPILEAGVSRGYSGAELFSQHFDNAMYDLLKSLRLPAEAPQLIEITDA